LFRDAREAGAMSACSLREHICLCDEESETAQVVYLAASTDGADGHIRGLLKHPS